MHAETHAARQYSPLYFLASLGAGGLVVTFFMYLMFWVPHPGQPVPVFEDIVAFFSNSGPLGQAMVVIAMAGIALFGALHYRLLFWNLSRLREFRKAEGFAAFSSSNAESQLLAAPLAMAMGVNVGFIIGLVFVPGLWSVVEYLFPIAMLVFVAIGTHAFRQIGAFLGRVFGHGGFTEEHNASFAQVLPAFALAMVGVGLAAPAAMSGNGVVVAVSLSLSTLFNVAAVVWALVAMILALRPILKHGTAPEAAPTLMILVPLLTVVGIAMLRMDHGLHTQFDAHGTNADTLVFLTRIVAAQVLFLGLGLAVLKRQGYAATFLSTQGQRSAGSYALVCPGVGCSVMWHFWVNKGLGASGLIAKFGAAYWIATAPALIAQIAMIGLVIWLHRQHFGKLEEPAAVPAE